MPCEVSWFSRSQSRHASLSATISSGSSVLFVELDAGLALDAASHHGIPQLGVGEELPGSFDGVELVDDQDIVGIAYHPVNRLGDNAASGLHRGEGVIDLPEGVVVVDTMQHKGNGHGWISLIVDAVPSAG